jgi:glycosyltransferase involved in cell wall biosynthesis
LSNTPEGTPNPSNLQSKILSNIVNALVHCVGPTLVLHSLYGRASVGVSRLPGQQDAFRLPLERFPLEKELAVGTPVLASYGRMLSLSIIELAGQSNGHMSDLGQKCLF